MEILGVILFCLSLVLKLFSVYCGVTAVFTLRRQRHFPRTAPRLRFAVLTAARNEEAVIAGLIGCVRQQEYPPELVDIFVAPNNCTDNTEAVAAAAGARILHCREDVACKGDVLHQAFAQLMQMDYDAFVVVDADNTLSPDFLARMNDAFAAGAMVCKSRVRAGNPTDGAVAGCYGLYNTSMDLVWNRPRATCGLSVRLIGSGFAVRREALEQLGGWDTLTITEDAEFAVQLIEAGYRVTWVPDAVNYDEEPTNFLVSLRQRKRWISGIMQVAKTRLGKLWRSAGPRPLLRLDTAVFLLLPFAQGTSAILMLTGLLLRVLSGDIAGLLLFLGGLGLSWVGAMLLAAALSLMGGYGLKGMVPAILLFPIFTVSWMPLQVISLFRDTKNWHPIVHYGGAPAASRT